jgi:hypothetical protein
VTVEADGVNTKAFVKERAVFSIEVVERREREVISGDVVF